MSHTCQAPYRFLERALDQLSETHIWAGKLQLSLAEKLGARSAAYAQFCSSPIHTIGERLLDIRRDKRERAANAAAVGNEMSGDQEEEPLIEAHPHVEMLRLQL